MSLILDALRRADSERERGAVPGLHAQPAPALSVEVLPPTRAWPWQPIAIVAFGGLLAMLAWVIMDREPHQAAVPAVARAPVASAPAGPPTSPPQLAESPSAAAAAPPAAGPPLTGSQPEAKPVAEPAPWPAPEGRKAPTAGSAAPSARPAPDAQAVPQAVSVASIEPPITQRGQLPDNIRAQLPPLAVGGSIYSANAPDRSVIIDGRIYRENDRLTADLSLEQIRPRSAVLRYKGHRFEIGF